MRKKTQESHHNYNDTWYCYAFFFFYKLFLIKPFILR